MSKPYAVERINDREFCVVKDGVKVSHSFGHAAESLSQSSAEFYNSIFAEGQAHATARHAGLVEAITEAKRYAANYANDNEVGAGQMRRAMDSVSQMLDDALRALDEKGQTDGTN